ncbi:hydrogenase maturation factor HypF (carbamoyltransferase family) [Streptacidiphilus sp. EB129]
MRNDGGRVTVLALGRPSVLLEFLGRLQGEAPPLARITGISATPVPGAAAAGHGFTVLASGAGAGNGEIPPDSATCPACLRELLDPADRRYRYPFLN